MAIPFGYYNNDNGTINNYRPQVIYNNIFHMCNDSFRRGQNIDTIRHIIDSHLMEMNRNVYIYGEVSSNMVPDIVLCHQGTSQFRKNHQIPEKNTPPQKILSDKGNILRKLQRCSSKMIQSCGNVFHLFIDVWFKLAHKTRALAIDVIEPWIKCIPQSEDCEAGKNFLMDLKKDSSTATGRYQLAGKKLKMIAKEFQREHSKNKRSSRMCETPILKSVVICLTLLAMCSASTKLLHSTS